MKLQIDTKQKTIKVEENVNIEEFYKVIKKMFPNDVWKQFTLKTNTVINYSPWIIWRYENPYFPDPSTADLYPWYKYEYTTSDGTVNGVTPENGGAFTYKIEEGLYNINAII